MKYEEEVIDVIDDLYSKEKFLSPKSLSKVFYILKDYYELNDYLELLLFDNENQENKLTTGYYDNYGKYIIFYKKNINYLIRSLMFESKTEDRITKPFINFVLIGILIHEMKHINQSKFLVESDNYDSKYELYRHCLIDDFIQNVWNKDYLKRYYGMDIKDYYGKKYDKFYRQVKRYNDKYFDLYDYDPLELEAEYFGRNEVLHISRSFKSDIASIISNNLNEMRIEFINSVYKVNRFKIISPSEIFRFKYNRIMTMDSIKKEEIYNSSLDLNSKVALGLPITRNEYNLITKM